MSGQTLVLVDSVLGTGATTSQATRLLREHGARVEHLVVLLDRERGGREALAREGVAAHAVAQWAELGVQDESLEPVDVSEG